ncbi:Gfo/Idh/MocA family protein [Bacillus sp. JJ722]|uniref:Gfo/Idh/MocA family protein n=1 Tax=Bacillus sp. JJ722 TaxID=3122973 RepID=UPI002FFDB0A4
MKTLKVAIVGCGNIFPMHALSIGKLENVELIAVCDNKEDRAIKKAEELSCRPYVNYKEMIDQEDIDVLHICLPHYLHAEVAIYASERNIHVLTEKPMSISIEDAEKMVQTANDHEVTLGVIFQNRYNPGAVAIKDAIQSGALGNVLSGKLQVTWRRTDEYYSTSDWKGTWEKEGGGVVIDQAIHTLDLMRWFVNAEIDYISANIGNRAHEIIEVEDTAEGVIAYKNGVTTAFQAINYYGYDAPVEIEVYCENGIAKMVGDRGHIMFNDGREIIADNDPTEIIDYGNNVKSYWGSSHIKQIKNFYEALENNVQPDITGKEALKTQKMICNIYESGKTNSKVYVRG